MVNNIIWLLIRYMNIDPVLFALLCRFTSINPASTRKKERDIEEPQLCHCCFVHLNAKLIVMNMLRLLLLTLCGGAVIVRVGAETTAGPIAHADFNSNAHFQQQHHHSVEPGRRGKRKHVQSIERYHFFMRAHIIVVAYCDKQKNARRFLLGVCAILF